jgi:hypothetical protein
MKVHWMPDAPFSWPSGPGNVRTFHLGKAIVCTARNHTDRTATSEAQLVTCKRCLKIIDSGRFDTGETVNAVLARGKPLDEGG